MNRAIERRLADKASEIAMCVSGGAVGGSLGMLTLEVQGDSAQRKMVNPYIGARLVRLAMLITEYNTLQALQAEIDS